MDSQKVSGLPKAKVRRERVPRWETVGGFGHSDSLSYRALWWVVLAGSSPVLSGPLGRRCFQAIVRPKAGRGNMIGHTLPPPSQVGGPRLTAARASLLDTVKLAKASHLISEAVKWLHVRLPKELQEFRHSGGGETVGD